MDKRNEVKRFYKRSVVQNMSLRSKMSIVEVENPGTKMSDYEMYDSNACDNAWSSYRIYQKSRKQKGETEMRKSTDKPIKAWILDLWGCPVKVSARILVANPLGPVFCRMRQTCFRSQSSGYVNGLGLGRAGSSGQGLEQVCCKKCTFLVFAIKAPKFA